MKRFRPVSCCIPFGLTFLAYTVDFAVEILQSISPSLSYSPLFVSLNRMYPDDSLRTLAFYPNGRLPSIHDSIPLLPNVLLEDVTKRVIPGSGDGEEGGPLRRMINKAEFRNRSTIYRSCRFLLHTQINTYILNMDIISPANRPVRNEVTYPGLLTPHAQIPSDRIRILCAVLSYLQLLSSKWVRS